MPHKLTNAVVLLSAMMLAGVVAAGLGLSLRFSMITGSLLVMCAVVATGLLGALALYRRGAVVSKTAHPVTHQGTP
jgi:hypothetical protein